MAPWCAAVTTRRTIAEGLWPGSARCSRALLAIPALTLLWLPCSPAVRADGSGPVAPVAASGMSVPLGGEFFFQLQGQPTRRQQGHRIDVGVGVRYRPGMTGSAGPMRYPDYRLLQAGIEELLQPTPAVPIDSWWEVVVKAMAQAVLERGHGTLAGVTVQLRVLPLVPAQPGLHRRTGPLACRPGQPWRWAAPALSQPGAALPTLAPPAQAWGLTSPARPTQPPSSRPQRSSPSAQSPRISRPEPPQTMRSGRSVKPAPTSRTGSKPSRWK